METAAPSGQVLVFRPDVFRRLGPLASAAMVLFSQVVVLVLEYRDGYPEPLGPWFVVSCVALLLLLVPAVADVLVRQVRLESDLLVRRRLWGYRAVPWPQVSGARVVVRGRWLLPKVEVVLADGSGFGTRDFRDASKSWRSTGQAPVDAVRLVNLINQRVGRTEPLPPARGDLPVALPFPPPGAWRQSN